MMNFWQSLPRPFTMLAPLDGATDTVFRQMISKIGKPDVLFTEFVSCDGFQSPGRERVGRGLLFDPVEQPVVAQIWGIDPNTYYQTARDIAVMGFSGIDINMGCPIEDIIKDGACSALIKNHKLTGEIIKATKEGAGELPVSVKTRIGFDQIDTENWIGFLLEQKLSALTVHLRTTAELSKVPAHWEEMPKIVAMRNKIAPETVLSGNGDITSLDEIKEKFDQYKCDGFMVGRGIFANPWMFNAQRNMLEISKKERFETYLEHINLHEKTWGARKSTGNLKKFCRAYLNNFEDVTKYRDEIMLTQTLPQLHKLVESFVAEA